MDIMIITAKSDIILYDSNKVPFARFHRYDNRVTLHYPRNVVQSVTTMMVVALSELQKLKKDEQLIFRFIDHAQDFLILSIDGFWKFNRELFVQTYMMSRVVDQLNQLNKIGT